MTGALEFDPPIAAGSSNLTINHFYKAFATDDLILRPLFQRNLVWNDEQQSFLIDSILRGLPVPEVYIQSEMSPEGDERLVVVDGQQRISACLRFLSGELRLTTSDELDIRWRNKKFSELRGPLPTRFRAFELVVRKLPQVGDEALREIFRRLNKTNEALEPQELRHAAYTGPFIRLVEDLAASPTLSEVGVFSAKDYLRRRNDEFFAEVAYAVASKAYPNKKDGLDELFLTYERHGTPVEPLRDVEMRMGRALAQVAAVAGDLRRTRFRNKSDFYTLMVLLCKQAEVLPLPQEGQAAFVETLRAFSATVNDIKREEAERRSVDDLTKSELGTHALKYLRAVERAASDRLNRVRREQALASVLGESFAAAEARPLSEEDVAWRNTPPSDDEEDGFDVPVTLEDKVRAQQALLAAAPEPTLPKAHPEVDAGVE